MKYIFSENKLVFNTGYEGGPETVSGDDSDFEGMDTQEALGEDFERKREEVMSGSTSARDAFVTEEGLPVPGEEEEDTDTESEPVSDTEEEEKE